MAVHNPTRNALLITLSSSAALAALLWISLHIDPVLCWLVAVNLVTLATYGYDKQIAGTGKTRVPERVLLLLVLAGGTPAAWAGMRIFHHKTRKSSFQIRFWAIGITQFMLLLVYYFLLKR